MMLLLLFEEKVGLDDDVGDIGDEPEPKVVGTKPGEGLLLTGLLLLSDLCSFLLTFSSIPWIVSETARRERRRPTISDLILVSCPRIVPVTSRRADDNASSLFSLSTNLDSRSSILRFAFVTSCIAYSSGVEIETGGLEEGELTGKRGPVEMIRPRLDAERGLKLLFSSAEEDEDK